MLKRLLKYDLRAIFRIWWIAAAASVLMSFIGGGCLYIIDNERYFPTTLYTLANVLVALVYFTLAALMTLTMILIFIRLYRNFFTDEGYLTFTLPVRRRDLVNSKVISGSIMQIATTVLLFLDVMLMGFLQDPKLYLNVDNWEKNIGGFWNATEHFRGYLAIYAVELLLLGVLCIACSILFLYVCISFASMIVKRGKLIAAIGIYYGANSILVFLMELMLLFGLVSIGEWLSPLGNRAGANSIVFLLAGAIFFAGMFCSLFYCLFHYLVDRKLNLS